MMVAKGMRFPNQMMVEEIGKMLFAEQLYTLAE